MNKSDTFPSINPATEEINGQIKTTSPDEIKHIIEASRQAFPDWQNSTIPTRKWILSNVQQLLLEKKHEFADLITREMGRPLSESLILEVESVLDLLNYYQKNANRLLKPEKVILNNIFFIHRKSMNIKKPVGVMGIISPWNWPLLIPMGCIVPALLAGNCVIHKHSEHTPLLNKAMLDLFTEAGLPDHIFQIIQGDGKAGKALIEGNVDKLFFTGSTQVGQDVMKECSRNLTPVVLELGGQDAAIVCQDTDLENTTSGLVWGSFMNAGQNCNSVERIYVEESISDLFIKQFVDKTKQLKIGDSSIEEMDLGPLATKPHLEKMKKLLADISENEEILYQGQGIQNKKGYYFEPVIVKTKLDKANIWKDEVFGPMISITPVSDLDKAIDLANDSIFGLAASVWTSNLKKGKAIARQIESGTVMINDCIVSFGMPEAGWTGVKKSGIGWMHGKKGFEEMITIQYINTDTQYRRQNFWSFPYKKTMSENIKYGMTFLYHKNWLRKIQVAPKVIFGFWKDLLLNKKNPDKL